jgi:flavoprotein
MINQNMTIADCRNAGYCVRGCKKRCAELGLDFKVFMREGFPVEQMAQLDDAEIVRTLVITRARIAGSE